MAIRNVVSPDHHKRRERGPAQQFRPGRWGRRLAKWRRSAMFSQSAHLSPHWLRLPNRSASADGVRCPIRGHSTDVLHDGDLRRGSCLERAFSDAGLWFAPKSYRSVDGGFHRHHRHCRRRGHVCSRIPLHPRSGLSRDSRMAGIDRDAPGHKERPLASDKRPKSREETPEQNNRTEAGSSPRKRSRKALAYTYRCSNSRFSSIPDQYGLGLPLTGA